MTVPVLIAVTLTLAAAPSIEQDPHGQRQAAMDHRGHLAMGFDQAKIQHSFSTGEHGGAIQVVAKDPTDAKTIAEIRTHLREITKLFKEGDFSKPIFIHAQNPPGADTMKARRADIQYRYDDIPTGARVTVRSSSGDAVAAIHAFLKFQQSEHK